jgi:patatin-like phospholipase/acyl hydrolase
MSHYHVLSMDGGGIRGILTARILERINEVLPGFLDRVELFAGTSTGGLLALGLASGKTPKEMRELYQKFADRVFADSLLDELKDLGNLVGAEYSAEPLREVLEEYFPATALSDLPKKVLVSTFKLDNEGKRPDGVRIWKMKFFHNYPGPDSDGDQLVVDVGVRTSVAPAYFPVYQGYIDGGVAASNPAMCALAQALDRVAGRQNICDVNLLSMGTGYNRHYLPVQNADWGLVQWAPHLINIMLEGDQDLVDFQCRQVLDDQYFRVNPLLPREIGLGSIKYIPELLETANKADLSASIAWIKKYFLEDE